MIKQDHVKSVVDSLMALFNKEFGGKVRGRYKISIKQLSELWGGTIRPVHFEEIMDEVYSRDYVIFQYRDCFHVIDGKTVESWRPVPKRILADEE